MSKIKLDSSKILWHQERVQAWSRGERVYPINIDMCLTRVCNYRCEFCFGKTQENKREKITKRIIDRFIADCAEMDVKSISLVSDGESTCHPDWVYFINEAKKAGIDMAIGSNGYLVTKDKLLQVLPDLTYMRFNISAGKADRYAQIHGVGIEHFHQVEWNILDAVEIKEKQKLACTIGLQMVCKPEYKDDIMPLAKLAVRCKVDYLVIKHCADNPEGDLGVEYEKYPELYATMRKAEKLSNKRTKIVVKWNKIKAGNVRTYKQCYAPPLQMQLSGSGLVAPCGMLFNEKYSKYHVGNICKTSFKKLLDSDKYWDIIRELASDKFDANTMCGGCLCLQDLPNRLLDSYKKGEITLDNPFAKEPEHSQFP